MKIYFHHLSDGTLELAKGQFHNPLSPRECEVIALMIGGLTDKAIAYTLSIAVDTVRQHIRWARFKLRAPSRAALAVACMRLVPPPTPPAPVIAFRRAA